MILKDNDLKRQGSYQFGYNNTTHQGHHGYSLLLFPGSSRYRRGTLELNSSVTSVDGGVSGPYGDERIHWKVERSPGEGRVVCFLIR